MDVYLFINILYRIIFGVIVILFVFNTIKYQQLSKNFWAYLYCYRSY